MTIRWGLIGTGDVTEQKSGPALYQAERSELVAVTNRTLSRAESFAQRHNVPHVHGSTDELLHDPNIDAVYIATAPDSHRELTVRAARAGKHVFCEKPMALSRAECDDMVRVCSDCQVSLSVAYYRRYFPVVQKMKELVAAGRIGQPLRISATTYSKFTIDHPNTPQPWRLDPVVSGGGFLMDMGTHRLDLFAYFFGKPKVVRGVIGTQSSQFRVEDAASVAIEFENGVQGSAAFQWNCPVYRDSLTIVGDAGIVSTDSLSNLGRLSLETPEGVERWELPSAMPVHLNLVQRLVDHLLDGSENPCPGSDALLATSMVDEIYHQDQR